MTMTTPTTTTTSQSQSQSHSHYGDIVSQINGNFGRWQLRTILLIFLCKIPTAWFTACIIYTAPTPKQDELICKPVWNESSIEDSHWFEERKTDRHFEVDVCSAYAKSLSQSFVHKYKDALNIGGTKEIPCERVEHHSAYKSLVTQFDLMCSRSVLVAVTQSFHALGALLGGLLAHAALKRISPRRLMLLGMLGQIFCGNLTGLVDTYQLHIYFRCLTSLSCALMYTSGQFILNDITTGNARIIVIALSELFWSIGLILLPAISIYFDSWSYLYVAISSSLFILVWLHRWTADAPRWLLRHGKIDRALRLLLESATYNNRMVPLTLDVKLTAYAAELSSTKPVRYCHIWDGETKHSQLIYIHCIWGCATVLYNIILLMIRSLGAAQVHVNTAGLGFAEMLGVFVGLYFILYTRRHWRWAGNLIVIVSLCTYAVWLLPDSTRTSRRVGMEFFIWVLLKFANSATLTVLTTCTGEMVSAEKRVLLMLSVVSFSRLSLVFTPMLTTLVVIHRLLPITIIATLGWIYGLALRRLNRYYWNTEQPHINAVLTPTTYRKNSAIMIQSLRSSDEIPSSYNPSLDSDTDLSVKASELFHINFSSISANVSEVELTGIIKPTSSTLTI